MTAVYVFGGILAILLAAVVIAPLVERTRGGDAEAAATPEARKDRALEGLRELEFEFATGKIPDEDYRVLRARLAAEAIAARDALGQTGATTHPGACGVCGAPLRASAKFCSRCGQAVEQAAGA